MNPYDDMIKSIREYTENNNAIIDMWLDDMPYIDWSTCFDTNNIRVAV